MTYEYECRSCSHQWEEVQSMLDDPLTVCQRCSQPTARRLISKPSEFLLKGGGWYADGYGARKVSE